MKNLWERMLLLDKEGNGGNGGDGKSKDPPAGKEKEGGKEKPAPTFDDWLKGQDALTQSLIEGHVSGLKTALGSERDARDTAEKDLRDVAKKLEEGSEAQKEVLKLADEVATGNVKADFYEDAHEAGVINIKLAFHIATTEDLFDKRGNADFEKLKENYPELFDKLPRKPAGGAGHGKGDDLGQPGDMNTFIRRQAGRS